MKFKYIALAIFYVFFSEKGKAQKQPDSLSVYLEIAAKNNPTVIQKYYEYQAALQKVPQVGSLPDPELNIGYFLKPMEQLNGKQIADIRLMQMFPWKGTLKAAKDEMSLMAKAKYESFLDAKSTVFYNVQNTWFELFNIEKKIQITSKNINILQMIERMELVKFRTSGLGSSISSTSGVSIQYSNVSNSTSGMQTMTSGTAPTAQSMQSGTMGSSIQGSGLAGLFKIKIAIQDLQNDSASLQNQKETIAAKFNSYLNRSERSTVYIPDSIQLSVLDLSLQAVSDSIKSNSPMLGMLDFEQKSLDSRMKMVNNMGYPMIGIGVDYSLINKSEMSTSAMNGKDMIMPMLTVTLPIYRNKYKAMVTEAELLKKAKAQEYTATVNTLQTEYFEAVQFYQDADRRMKLYSNQYQIASRTLDLLLSSFTSSGIELNDILSAQQQMLDYELKQEEAKVDHNTAIALLNQLMAFSKIQ
jgi:outer membrane protein TolC